MDPVLVRFRTALQEMYGDRLDRVVLFGSRARGDATAESDYDVAVFLKDMPDRWAELDRLAMLRVRFLDEEDAFFDALPFSTKTDAGRSILLSEIKREGRLVP